MDRVDNARPRFAPSMLFGGLFVKLLVISGALGCGDNLPDPQAQLAMETAIVEYPRFADVQERLLSQTCSPNPGVCHSSRQEPDLRTLGSTKTQRNARCNVNHPEPMLGWDQCEGVGDVIELDGWRSEIAWFDRTGPGAFQFSVREPLPENLDATLRILRTDADGSEQLSFEAPVKWAVELGLGELEHELVVVVGDVAQHSIADAALSTTLSGDANRNGVYGADPFGAAPAAMIRPGDLENSYLWRRLIGDVPGSRMPLANGPVTNPQLFALGCWIEGLSELEEEVDEDDDVIDYGACSFYDRPQLLVEPNAE